MQYDHELHQTPIEAQPNVSRSVPSHTVLCVLETNECPRAVLIKVMANDIGNAMAIAIVIAIAIANDMNIASSFEARVRGSA